MTNEFTPITTTRDGVTFQLKQEHHFSWLSRLGTVFAVFDQQDSGNISFGIQAKGQKIFVKFAGARTINYDGDPQDAVIRLKRAVRIFSDLQHPHLVNIIEHFAVDSGYVCVYEWFEGESLFVHAHAASSMSATNGQLDSPITRFRKLPLEQRLAAIASIFNFHLQVEACQYVAVDFYDGSLLYDFEQHIIKICDIDLYEKQPYTNVMGRMWGSSRFMAPEEFELGSILDETTNVYRMGATAFVLLGGSLDRSLSKWEAGKDLYDVALRAVASDRQDRYASVAELVAAWELGLGHAVQPL
ncbi:serine/threonine-protein kinase [Paenibacillus sp. 481]|uniref:serine/threonine-protein kinase n=1 Tax=Paenibacillus sp. 481 TaxID=2835869 RepID=UPI001E4F2031|nr:serine/threonine-protein kinase [Paenibacillus sp. 481]UHA75739.1 serine/threonine protein kinase [Paenibacillus sp. 481]